MHVVCSFLRWISEIRTGRLPLVQPDKLCVRLLIVAIQESRRFSVGRCPEYRKRRPARGYRAGRRVTAWKL